MLDQERKKEIKQMISDALDNAERHWKNGGYLLKESRVLTTLERVYSETSTLLFVIEQTIKYSKGTVMEYLGDRVLAFFKVDGFLIERGES